MRKTEDEKRERKQKTGRKETRDGDGENGRGKEQRQEEWEGAVHVDNEELRHCSCGGEESKGVWTAIPSRISMMSVSRKLARAVCTRNVAEHTGAQLGHASNLATTPCDWMQSEHWRAELSRPSGPLGWVHLSTAQATYPLQDILDYTWVGIVHTNVGRQKQEVQMREPGKHRALEIHSSFGEDFGLSLATKGMQWVLQSWVRLQTHLYKHTIKPITRVCCQQVQSVTTNLPWES